MAWSYEQEAAANRSYDAMIQASADLAKGGCDACTEGKPTVTTSMGDRLCSPCAAKYGTD